MEATNELFARIEGAAPVLTVRVKGPALSDREGAIVHKQIASHLDGLDEKVHHVVLDLNDVTFLNSSGIGALITMRTDITKRGVNVILYELAPDILQVLKITQLDKLFQVATDAKRLTKLTSKTPK